MGGSGGGNWLNTSPKSLAEQVRKSEIEAKDEEFNSALAQEFSTLLSGYNDRDTELVRARLDECQEAIGQNTEGNIDQIFGGSVAKNTYVDGMSDIDSLTLFDRKELHGRSPSEVLSDMANSVRGAPGVKDVYHGEMAVTVEYGDGMSIQMLPAVRQSNGKLRVPSSRGLDEWSSINPKRFQEALTRRNEECGGKLVPTIKLAKAINSTLPEAQRLSGYHVESMAISAFRGYDGPKTTLDMLPRFFEQAKELVKSPVRDSTGQSVHVDGYLGDAGSSKRLAVSHVLGAIEKRMRNASAASNLDRWKAIFGVDT